MKKKDKLELTEDEFRRIINELKPKTVKGKINKFLNDVLRLITMILLGVVIYGGLLWLAVWIIKGLTGAL